MKLHHRMMVTGTIVVAALGVLLSLTVFFVSVPAAAFQPPVDLRARLTLDIALTEAQQELGLGGRASMSRDHGMLFVFGQSAIYPFWMKGMHFSLDIVWIQHGVVQEIAHLPPPLTASSTPITYLPHHRADRVLEVDSGVAKSLGLSPGSRVILPD